MSEEETRVRSSGASEVRVLGDEDMSREAESTVVPNQSEREKVD